MFLPQTCCIGFSTLPPISWMDSRPLCQIVDLFRSLAGLAGCFRSGASSFSCPRSPLARRAACPPANASPNAFRSSGFGALRSFNRWRASLLFSAFVNSQAVPRSPLRSIGVKLIVEPFTSGLRSDRTRTTSRTSAPDPGASQARSRAPRPHRHRAPSRSSDSGCSLRLRTRQTASTPE